MDTKRKANGVSASDSDDRSSKRRKVSPHNFDLSKGESRDSTTAYGLSFLDQIRRTADKSGRLVAGYFEELIPREGNEDYYRRIRMPISLQIIEDKLENREFKNLAELEGYFKRMISNAKEYYPRSSSTFEDAERVRKALSNYMTKTNPAYGTRNYQALPTPLPAEGEEEGEEEESEEDQAAGDGERESGDEEEDEDAEGEEEEAEDNEDEDFGSRRRSIILKRRGPGRPPRHSNVQESPRPSSSSFRLDHQYDKVPYKGLTFQEAQEKIVEELLRYKEPEYEGYFEPFVNLPPRALKDYYKVITDPLSLKKLQKLVRGIHARGDAGGQSDFKSWNAFEEKAKLLWDNAYYYNEEGSEIYDLAHELEQAFADELKQAQKDVAEPAQPKIKLKVGQSADPVSSSKRITIHVGGRGGSVDSPGPQASRATDSPANGQEVNGTSKSPLPGAEKPDARTGSGSAVSPSPAASAAIKGEESARISPAVRGMSATPGVLTPGSARPPIPAVPSQPYQATPLTNGHVDQKRLRQEGKGIEDALIKRLRVQTHPANGGENLILAELTADPKEMQQAVTITLPPSYGRVCIVPMLPEFLNERHYNMWTMINKQTLKPSPQPIPNQHPQERVFEIYLHPGVNLVETHLVAALPRSERVQGESEVEIEIFTVHINVTRI